MLRENKLGIFANLILVMLMASSICQTVYTSLFMTYELSLTIFIAVVPLTLLFFVMFRSKVSAIVSAIVVCVMLIVGLVFILYNTGIANAENWLSGYSTWFIDVLNGFKDVSNQLYSNVTLISLAFIITLLIYMFSVKFYNFYVISIMLFSVFFVQLQFNTFVSNKSFILFMFSFLLYYFFDVLKRRRKELTYDVGNSFKYLINIIPICVVVIIVSFSFTIKNTRSALPWLDTKFDSAIENIIDLFSNKDISNFDYFSIESTGFGTPERLGGNIKLSKTHVMNVKSEFSSLYLKASSKAFYNGHGWYDDNKQLIPLENDLKTYSNQINYDSNELITGNLMMVGTNANDAIFESDKAEIEYVNLKTKSLFIPSKIDFLTLKTPLSLFYDNEQMISSVDMQNKDFKYNIGYKRMLLNDDKFKTALRKSYRGYINEALQSSWENSTNSSDKNSLQTYFINNAVNNLIQSNKFQDKVETIYRKYTQLPDITPRVHQLAIDLTKGKDNNYDKAKAIEDYLSSNYPYTLKPGNPPRKKDFVDYFLFEGKKGYCTYYASAMTVLLRCVDIPARYVEGYILPPETNKKGVFEVTNQQAHAWVEVYFEGLGWIPFEPTAPFVANMYNDKTVTAKVSSDMLNSTYTDYMAMMEKYGKNNKGFTYDNGDSDSATTSKSNKLIIVLIIISALIVSTLLAFGILVLINIFKFYRTLRRIRKGDPNSSVLMAYNYIVKVLGIQNLVFIPGETPSQFGIRVDKTLDFMSYSFNKTSFIKITNHYVKARYSNTSLLKSEQQDMLDFIDILLSFTMEKIGRTKFILARYLFGKI